MKMNGDTENTNLQKIETLADDNTMQWMLQKSKELFTLMSYYKCAMMEIETKLNVLDEEFSLRFDRNPISTIKTRLKSITSIRKKLERRNLPFNAATIESEISDVAGVRVICPFVEDIYTLARCLLSQDDIVLVQKKDYIKNPKPNGYRSLHLIVEIPIFLQGGKRSMRAEIQLRTIAMDCWASLEHQLRYKKTNAFTEEMTRELMESAELCAELDTRMDRLRRDMLMEETQEREEENN